MSDRKVWDETYKLKHAEEIRARQRLYSATHRDERSEYNRKYREAHREELRAKSKEYGDAHREQLNSYARQYRKHESPEIHRARHLKSVFGITAEEYQRLFDAQKGKCAICGCDQSEDKRRFAVDHNHDTGKIRGLLCGKCNKALGLFRETIDLLEKAITYMENDGYAN